MLIPLMEEVFRSHLKLEKCRKIYPKKKILDNCQTCQKIIITHFFKILSLKIKLTFSNKENRTFLKKLKI